MIHDVPIPPEKQFVIVWQSADYVEPDEPLYAHDWPELLAQARKSLETRRASYPAWVKAGRITEEQAEADIQAWAWIVDEWHWVITGEGAPPPSLSLSYRRAAVKLSLDRVDAELKRGNRTHDMHRQAHLLMALEWHLDQLRFGVPMIHLVSERNHARWRAREAFQQQRNAA